MYPAPARRQGHRLPGGRQEVEVAVPESIGLVGLFGLLLVKEAGVPIPVPGDLLVIGAGVASAHGDLDPATALVAILLAGYIGGSIQFALLRGGLRRPLLALLGRFGIRRERVERHAERLRQRGAGGVAISRATPGLRVVAIAASAMAALPFSRFALGLMAGNTAFVGFHFALGLVAGEPAVRLIASLGTTLAVGGVALAVLGGAGWWLLRRRRGARAPKATPAAQGSGPIRTEATGSSVASGEDAFSDWADATCPVCLTLGLAGLRFEET